jgi:hypothetical protein
MQKQNVLRIMNFTQEVVPNAPKHFYEKNLGSSLAKIEIERNFVSPHLCMVYLAIHTKKRVNVCIKKISRHLDRSKTFSKLWRSY